VPDPTRDFCLLDSHQYGTNEFNENYVTFRVEGPFRHRRHVPDRD
jgi:hypothetical protein